MDDLKATVYTMWVHGTLIGFYKDHSHPETGPLAFQKGVLGPAVGTWTLTLRVHSLQILLKAR